MQWVRNQIARYQSEGNVEELLKLFGQFQNADWFTYDASAVANAIRQAELQSKENKFRYDWAIQNCKNIEAQTCAHNFDLWRLNSRNWLLERGVNIIAATKGSSRGRLTENTRIIPMTNGEAKIAASKLGYQDTGISLPNGQKVFLNPKASSDMKYISQDIGSGNGLGSHNGGSWKAANSIRNLGSKETRTGTFDINLNRIGK